MATSLTPFLRQRYFTTNGAPLAGGKLYSYQAGTTTPQVTYTDSGAGTPNANPVILDANGEANVWLDQTLSYKFVLKDSTDVTQWTTDGVIGVLTNAAVATASLQDQSVTTIKIADKAVTSAKLASDTTIDVNRAVTTDHIRDSAVTAAKIFADLLIPSGSIFPYMGTAAPSGWLMSTGGTIGNASSGGTARANADTVTLFTLIWNSTTQTDFPIQTSAGGASTRGVSAAVDYASNKRLPLPDLRNVFLRGANASTRSISGVSYPAVTLGATSLDKLQGHIHNPSHDSYLVNGGTPGANITTGGGGYAAATSSGGPADDGTNGVPRTGSETVPVNFGITYIIKI